MLIYINLLVSLLKRDGLSKKPILAPIFLLILGLCSIAVSFFFPLDEGGEITSIIGLLHFILVMCMPVLTLGAQLALWRGLKNVPTWKKYSLYSLLSFILTIVIFPISLSMIYRITATAK